MKKYSLLKIIGLIFLVVVVLSWIIPVGGYSTGAFVTGSQEPVGIFDLSRIPLITIANLLQYGLIIVLIGGLYGVINKTGVYSNFVESIVSKLKGKEKLFIILTIVTLTLFSSFLGLPFVLFLLVPFLVAVIRKLGLSKLTALATTIGSILVGNVGAIYSSEVNYYINNYLSLGLNDEIGTKLIFLTIITFLLVIFVLKDVKVEKQSKKEEKKEDVIPLYEENKKKKSSLPLIVVFAICFIFLTLNMIDFKEIFKVSFFEEIYNNITSLKIGSYPIVSNILGSIGIFGSWSLYDMCIFVVLMTIIIGWLYSLKFEEFMDGFVNGVKEMLVPAFYAIIANIIFVTLFRTQSTSNMYLTIANFLFNLFGNAKLVMMPIISAIGGFFFNDVASLTQVLVAPIELLVTDTTQYQLIGMIIQMIHGIIMLIIPTSILLITGLSYLKVSYKEWFKYIWKYLLQILAVSVAIMIIMGIFI